MKKLLLGTSALISAALLADGAMAETPKVTVGGFADFQVGIVDEDLDTGRGDYEAQNDTEIHFSIDGKSDNGLGYGAVIELEADVTADADGEGLNADKTYLYMEGGWGRFEMGSQVGVTNTMKVDASTFARATGGIDGDWYDFVNPASTGGYIISPDLLMDHGLVVAGDREDQTKVVYYSPRFSGFQLGAHFTPDTGDVGTAPFSGDTNGDAENVFGLGLNYTGQFDNVSVAASATGEFGGAEAAGAEDYEAYALGLNVGFAGFTVGGSWGTFDDSLAVADYDATFWNVGAAYDFGPFGASVTYLDTELGNNDFTNLSVGADYMLAPGLVPYVEVTFFELDNANNALDNEGSVLMVGTELSF